MNTGTVAGPDARRINPDRDAGEKQSKGDKLGWTEEAPKRKKYSFDAKLKTAAR